jgi:hypothetical protein
MSRVDSAFNQTAFSYRLIFEPPVTTSTTQNTTPKLLPAAIIMWLIHTESLELEQFFDENAPPYVILSHTWEDEEIDFQEMKSKAGIKLKKGYIKVFKCCMVAREDGYKYAWVDTCWYVPDRESRNLGHLSLEASIKIAAPNCPKRSIPCSNGTTTLTHVMSICLMSQPCILFPT